MKSPKGLQLIFALPALLLLFCRPVAAQQLSCDKLNQIIQVVAEDTLLTAIKGAPLEDKYDKEKHFMPLVTFWATENEMQSQFIRYDSERHTCIYHALALTEGTSGKEEVRGLLADFQKCLGTTWVLKNDLNGLGDSVFYLKNPANYVAVKLYASGGDVFVELYNDSSKGDECLYGNCDSNFGAKKYFNEDTYSGTFIDGQINGMGAMKFYSDGSTYQGAFIDGQIAGYGALYNAKSELVQSGVYFKGAIVNLDTTKKGCQFGDCKTGFGLMVIDGGFYAGNFKDGLRDGLGELSVRKTNFFGYFKQDQTNGKAIFITKEGDYIFGNYINGEPTGDLERDYADKTSKEANMETGKGSLFDEENILIKSGKWDKASFLEDASPAYLELKVFARSVKEFYGYRKAGYKQIRGEESKMLKTLGYEGYKSKALFGGTFPVYITTDEKRKYYVKVRFTGQKTSMGEAIDFYNKYYLYLNNGVGSRWAAITDDGVADANKTKAGFVLQNLFDKSKIISLSINGNDVVMELH